MYAEEDAVEATASQSTPPRDLAATDAQSEIEYDRWTGAKGIYRPAAATVEKLPSGIYEANSDPKGIYLEWKRFPSDNLIDLPGLPTRRILDEIQKFWAKKALFEYFGYLHKRGIMMCGPGGCGKTSIIRMICDDVIARDGIALLIHNVSKSVVAMKAIRDIEPDRPLVTVTEDLDEYFRADQSPKQILSLFDGENQVDHVVHIATTNYPERLEDRIIQRPSRFDMVFCLGTPVDEARAMYLRTLLNREVPPEVQKYCSYLYREDGTIIEDEFQTIVQETKGLTLAHLKEFVVSTILLEGKRDETLARLKSNMKKKPTLSKTGGMGFHIDGEGYTVQYFKDEKTETIEKAESLLK